MMNEPVRIDVRVACRELELRNSLGTCGSYDVCALVYPRVPLVFSQNEIRRVASFSVINY
jgi:hypothetical protein